MAKRAASDLAVAKISAWQAVAVAVITSVGGLLAGIWSQQREPAKRPPQRWLTITAVKFEHSSPPIEKVRLIATVNSVAFSVPVVEPWLFVDRPAPRARFPLPSDDAFRVQFSGFGVDSTERISFLCEFLQDLGDIKPAHGSIIRTARLDRAFDTKHCTDERVAEITYAVE